VSVLPSYVLACPHSSWMVSHLPNSPSPPLACSHGHSLSCPRLTHHLRMFLAHMKTHEQSPYNHHDDKDHHHNHDEKAFEVHWATGDAKPAPGACRVILTRWGK
jgi:hypothetical protein